MFNQGFHANSSITAGFDSATLVLLLALIFLVTLAVAFISSLVLISRVSKAKDETIQKIEDESNEIKTFNQHVVTRLLEIVSGQATKDIFQTIAQGSKPITSEK